MPQVTAKSAVPNHEHTGDGVHIRFDNMGFCRTSNPKLIRVLEKYSGRPGFWGIVDTTERSSDYKGTVRNKSYLIVEACKLGFSQEVGKDPRNARVEELLEFIESKAK